MPGAFGDPFRAIEALPGVMPLVSGLPFFYIRGAPPTNNAYLVDGIRCPSSSTWASAKASFIRRSSTTSTSIQGPPPRATAAPRGRQSTARTRDPATTLHGEANVRLIDAGALVESPLADGRASALVAGRYGYPGPIIDLVSPLRCASATGITRRGRAFG